MKKLTGLVLSGAMLMGTMGPLATSAEAQYRHHRRYNRHQGYYSQNGNYHRTHSGIGAGKGALIGGAGGAGVGALLGGGKGALIGGALGAGGGALAGNAAANRRHERERQAGVR